MGRRRHRRDARCVRARVRRVLRRLGRRAAGGRDGLFRRAQRERDHRHPVHERRVRHAGRAGRRRLHLRCGRRLSRADPRERRRECDRVRDRRDHRACAGRRPRGRRIAPRGWVRRAISGRVAGSSTIDAWSGRHRDIRRSPADRTGVARRRGRYVVRHARSQGEGQAARAAARGRRHARREGRRPRRARVADRIGARRVLRDRSLCRLADRAGAPVGCASGRREKPASARMARNRAGAVAGRSRRPRRELNGAPGARGAAEPEQALHRFASMQRVVPSKCFNWFLVKNRLMLTLLRFEGG
ncbi:conserved hypothetical protein [Burkholderia cenocepacia]|nr:conserved hypothetical protein [Burkholderia cenocepacia]